MSVRAWPFWRTIPRFDREYSLGDLFLAFRTLAGRPGGGATGVEQFVPPDADIYLTRSGRECLYLILKMLDLRARSRVGVPLYCCASVFEAIAAAGHVPVFLDVDLDSYELDAARLSQRKDQIDALIVVHTFGYPADFNRLRDCLGSRKIPIIEDCAHALFSEYRGKLVGTCSEASFFTFGMHKPAAVGGGAALFVNDPGLRKAAEREHACLLTETWTSELQHSLTCWARSLSYHRAAYGALLGSPLGRYRDEERNGSNGNGGQNSQTHFPPSQIRLVDRALVRTRIERFRSKLPVLAANTQKLRKAIGEAPVVMLAEPPFGKWNHFMVPLRYHTAKQRQLGRAFLVRRRIDTAPLYQNCARNARQFGYAGDCHQAEEIAQTICTVPNHPWLSNEEIKYIGESLRLSAELI